MVAFAIAYVLVQGVNSEPSDIHGPSVDTRIDSLALGLVCKEWRAFLGKGIARRV